MSQKRGLTKKFSAWTLPLLKYLFATLIVFIPLYPKFPLFTVPGTYVAIRVEDFIVVLLAVTLVLHLFFHDSLRRRLLKLPLTRSITIYWLVGLLSVISAFWVTRTISLHLGLLHWARRIEYMIPFFAALVLAQDRKNLIFFLKLLPAIALAVFAYGIAQMSFGAPVIITQNAEYSKGVALTLQPGVNLASTFAGHYDLATYLVMTISLFIALSFVFKNKLLKLLSLVLLLILFWLQLRTGSRIAFGAILVSSTIVLLLSKRPFWIIPLYIVAIIGLANTPSIAGRFSRLVDILQFQKLQQEVKGIFDSRTQVLIPSAHAGVIVPESDTTPIPTPTLRAVQKDRSISIRLDVEWPRALRAFAKNPFLGTGYSSLNLSTDNDYLRALGEVGILGFLSWLAIIISVFAHLVSGLKAKLSQLEHQYIIGTLAAFVGFLIIATFIDVFEASKVATLFWMYTGLAVGLAIKLK